MCFLSIVSFDDRKFHDADPILFFKMNSKWTFTYMGKSSTSTLHGHIKKWHLQQYLTMVESCGWLVWLNSIKMAITQGYLFTKLWWVVAGDRTLQNLPACQLDAHISGGNSHALVPPFSLEELHNHLVAFIVANNQEPLSSCILVVQLMYHLSMSGHQHCQIQRVLKSTLAPLSMLQFSSFLMCSSLSL